jgi:hypothetical protein
VRQGDPLSPLLFDFVAEALAAILDKALEAGHIEGVIPHIIPGGVSHLQYADDTIIMIQPDDLAITNLKFLLLCFENMSGLRINFHKSEVMVMGTSDREKQRIANMLNCKQGSFPFTYLGLPISDHAITAADWGPLTAKVAKRADPWTGKFMSSAAHLILVNACLSSLPLHAMGVCMLGDGIHDVLRKHRARFFWEANGPKKKYHWVRWDAVCMPKSMGGLGIMDTKLMNVCLMAKWVWKIMSGAQGLWVDIIRGKYLNGRDIWVDSHPRGSQFWNTLQKIKRVLCLGAKHHVVSGTSTRFWHDWWLGPRPFRERFPGLFAITADPEASVAQAAAGGLWDIPLRRELGRLEHVELSDIRRELQSVDLRAGRDVMRWSLEPSGEFSVRSLYLRLCQGTPRKHYGVLWRIAVPLKIRIFLWQLVRKRLPSNDNIRRRRGPSSGRCALCGEMEDTNHIFFTCVLARFMWSAVRELLHCSWNPTCLADVYRLLQPYRGQTKRVYWISCAALCWTLWNIRNKFTIEGRFPSQPADCIYKMSLYLQVWKQVARRQDREAVELTIDRLRTLHTSSRMQT